MKLKFRTFVGSYPLVLFRFFFPFWSFFFVPAPLRAFTVPTSSISGNWTTIRVPVVAPGNYTAQMFFATSATNYISANAAISDGTSANAPYLGPSSVPEPSTLVLLGVGAMGLLGYAWRRKRAA